MRMWCPHCGAEYVEGWGTCSTCGVLLVEDPPPQTSIEDEAWGLRRVRDVEDPFITIWEGPTPEANELLRKIQSRHIPVELDWKPAIKVAIAVTAIVLLLLLVFFQ